MSKARAAHAGGLFDHPGRLLTGAAVLVFALWNGFTASPTLHEELVGLVACALTVLFFANVLRTNTLSLHLQARDLALCRQLPAAIFRDSWIVTVVLLRDLLGIERAGSFYRDCGFQSSRRDPVLAGRSALAIAYLTMSPNMLVIGIDPAQSLMVFHQLRRDEIPETARRLGAQA